MPVSFGTVEVIPQPAAPASAGAGAAAAPAEPPAIDPRELAPALRQLADRDARIRAH
jgi:hypothetical protein